MSTRIIGRARWSSERRFYTGMAVALFLAVYVGFARSFFLRPLFPGAKAPHEAIFYVHGMLFAAWCVLLVAQAALIGVGRPDLHRRLGACGVVLIVSMPVLGLWGALVAAHRPEGFIGVRVPPLQFLVVPVFDVVLFATFAAMAVAKRRDLQSHKRLMLLATVNLTGAAFARWPLVPADSGPFVYYSLAYLFLVALAVWDFRSRGWLHPVTVWGGLAMLVSVPVRLALSGTALWLELARWATGLVG